MKTKWKWSDSDRTRKQKGFPFEPWCCLIGYDPLHTNQFFERKLKELLWIHASIQNVWHLRFFTTRWFGFSKKTGLSPLAPGQWKGFLAVYAGFYVFNNFIRPMRLAVSIGVTPYFDKAVAAIQRKTKFSKSVSIGIVVFLANVCGTTSLMSLGIYIASLAAGVPIFAK